MESLDYDYIAEVVVNAQQGSSDAFAELYAATYQKEYSLAYNFLKDQYLAQDALQETYILVLKSLNTLKDPRLFISWLNQICFRVCFDMRRKQNRATVFSGDYSETQLVEQGTDTNPEDTAIVIDEKEYIMRQIMSLPFSESQAIILRYYSNLKIDEVAKLMDISKSSVKRYLASGQKRLKALLEN